MAGRLVFIGGGDVLLKLGFPAQEQIVDTKYGKCRFTKAVVDSVEVFSVHRHDPGHHFAAHSVDYRRIIAAAATLRPDCVIGISICGSYCDDLDVGDTLFIDQVIDLTKKRIDTFYDTPGDVRHINVYEPICHAKRCRMKGAAASVRPLKERQITLVCIDGPRLSTRAELNWFRQIGGDVVNMSLAPEAFLARELGLCYVSISMVTDKADLAANDVTVKDMVTAVKRSETSFLELLEHLISSFSDLDFAPCTCSRAPTEAIFSL
ncbi:MTAP family purine nucleoside phosphorylase [Rhizobium lemnae]|uniref:MTAP family purine nucleoside phosphorylase n=1 Tax=Rhizobium lemnae TaxID=1214924 RepID=A0ABV8E471_9HYPH|nr:MTAP family purine nucleoside phosphorylase [Rhizobium lemnae]MCJ8510352.1 MTAP family purine nucleoside phosphorylase [Rhizobium lemnae]